MGKVSLTGEDVQVIDSRPITDFADGDTTNIDFPNNLVEVKTGKNGNTIYGRNRPGENATVTIRLLVGSSDDKYMNGRMAEYKADPASFPLISSEFIKRVGDGEGAVTNVIYKFTGGVIQKIPNTKENVEGDTEQSVVIWQMVFANAERIIA